MLVQGTVAQRQDAGGEARRDAGHAVSVATTLRGYVDAEDADHEGSAGSGSTASASGSQLQRGSLQAMTTNWRRPLPAKGSSSA